MRRVRVDGLQRMVSVLQEFEKDGAVDDSVCGKVVVPRGEFYFFSDVCL